MTIQVHSLPGKRATTLSNNTVMFLRGILDGSITSASFADNTAAQELQAFAAAIQYAVSLNGRVYFKENVNDAT